MNPASGPQLRDIHLPPPPAWWPPAPGWWMLAALLAMLLGFALYKFVQRRRRQAARRLALAELDRCIAAAGSNAAALAAALSHFLRRMALREAPAAAAFSDERWLAWLDARLGGEDFSRGVGRVLLDAPFNPAVAFDSAALTALVRRWTRVALTAQQP